MKNIEETTMQEKLAIYDLNWQKTWIIIFNNNM